ncbi:MAG: SLC13 family permease [Dehalococcoidia bacterium]|nr:SLC13 family permease [Dehalococcoidia bacterium]
MKKSGYIYIGLVLGMFLISALLGLSYPQVMAIGLFSAMLFGTLLFWRFRVAFALLAVATMLILGLTDVAHVIEFAGLDIILFLIGMMVVIGFLEERHFFEALIDAIVQQVGGEGKKLLVVLMLLSGFFAALVDEVTSTLFMMATLFQITTRYKLNPLPFLIMLIFATNVGSSATVVGNPVGIIIAMRGGLTFSDFLRWASPISLVVLVLTIVLCLIFFRKDVTNLSVCLDCDEELKNDDNSVKMRRIFSREFRVCWMLFMGTIVALILHSPLEHLIGLPKNTLLLAVSLTAAGIALMIEHEKARILLETRVDWWTLVFFLLLFTSVGTLQYVGVTSLIARAIVATAGSHGVALFMAIGWSTALLSAFMDNVLAVSTFVPVLKDLGSMGTDVGPLWWAMLFGGTLGGNATMIGSTANIVALGMMERRGLGTITFGQWIRAGVIITIPTLALALILLILQLYR